MQKEFKGGLRAVDAKRLKEYKKKEEIVKKSEENLQYADYL